MHPHLEGAGLSSQLLISLSALPLLLQLLLCCVRVEGVRRGAHVSSILQIATIELRFLLLALRSPPLSLDSALIGQEELVLLLVDHHLLLAQQIASWLSSPQGLHHLLSAYLAISCAGHESGAHIPQLCRLHIFEPEVFGQDGKLLRIVAVLVHQPSDFELQVSDSGAGALHFLVL